MSKAGNEQQPPDSTKQLEEKIDKLAVELVRIRLALSSLKKLSVGQIDFHLENLNIHEVSGALNIGITNGVNLQRTPSGQAEKVSKIQMPEITKEFARQKAKKSGLRCNIHFTG